MKSKTILTGVMAAVALCAVEADAQITYQNGDVLAGFRNNGGTDVIVDLGNVANFQQFNGGTTSFANVSSALTSVFGGTAGVYWSVFAVNNYSSSGQWVSGQNNQNTLWATLSPASGGSSAQQRSAGLFIGSIASSTDPSQYGTPSDLVSLNSGIVSVNYADSQLGYTPFIGDSSSNPGSGNLGGFWPFNIESQGAGTANFYESNPGIQGVTPTTLLGNFTLGSGGSLSFTAVPEPSTMALMGIGALAFAALRKNRKN